MKIIISLLFLFSINLKAESLPEVNLSSPRATFRTFLKAMVFVKKDQQKSDAYNIAIETLDISHFDNATKITSAKRVANQLVDIFDRIEKIDYESLPDKLPESTWIYNSIEIPNHLEIALEKDKNGQWKFSKTTIDNITPLYKHLKNRKVVSDVLKLESFNSKFNSILPLWTSHHFLFMTIAQWIKLLILLFFGWVIKKIINHIYIKFISSYLKIKSVPIEKIAKIAEPLGVIIALTFLLFTLPLLAFDDFYLAFWTRAFYIALSVIFIWLGLNIVNLVSLVLKKWADKTETKADDILIPLIEKVLKGITLIIGILFIAHSVKINIANMLAGLGIGAMAFAFAAKDTLANFFGSVMIVLDRPFDIGDYVIVDGLEGIIEEVGFRSTRIRSFQDSIISIPNGQLANLNINNFGRRRFRRTDISLGVEYSTSPELIQTFCDQIKDIIKSKEWLKDDQYLVYFNTFGDFSLNISVRVYIITHDFAVECDHKHEFLLDLLALGKKIGVEFAFPTQTLHVHKQ